MHAFDSEQFHESGSKSWFASEPFNMLIDYYPEITSRPYGSGATRDNVLPVLRDLDLGFIIVYAKGHGGHTTFNSRLDTAHPLLAKDMPVFFRELTRETGTKLFLYYSGLMDGLATQRHPDWRMVDYHGQPARHFEEPFDVFGYPVCPLSPYFDEWVTVHFHEIFATADPDGIWMDGDWTGPCYCSRCETRFRAETQFVEPLPPPRDLTSPAGIAWTRWWTGIVDEWWGNVSALIKALKPDCLYSSGNGSARTEFSRRFDWRSGDFITPYNHRLRQTVMMRRYTTQHLPYDAMTGDTSYVLARPQIRSRSKTLDRMLQEGAGILANGGQWCYWTYPMPNGALVPSKMRTASKAAAFARERRDVFLHTQSARWTAVLDAEPPASLPGTAQLPGDNVFGAAKALIALHRSPDVMDESGIAADMPYDLLVLPEQNELPTKAVEQIAIWVASGGRLLSTGASIGSPELRQLLGLELTEREASREGHVLRGNGDPTGIFTPWDRVAPVDAKELYPLYRSWDDDNPGVAWLPPAYPIDGMVDEEAPTAAGFPAATLRRVGKGVVIHVPSAIFTTYWRYGPPDVLAWIRELVTHLQPDSLFRTDALSFVEVSLRLRGNDLLIHFVNGNPGRDLSHVDTDDLWVDDIPSVGPITSWIRCRERPQAAYWMPGNAPADLVWDGELARVTLPRLDIHTCLVIPGWTDPRTDGDRR